ncbi:hypothetical protein Rhal01_03425 [Rubritalea halochordaticola]|uniref:Trimeric autotransporter adhesin YadA-like head domain-containing protein n=1 Tax=Rubritalea halochordaticola TaxID=714537 RepID=A0ABP9V3J5_9BACT
MGKIIKAWDNDGDLGQTGGAIDWTDQIALSEDILVGSVEGHHNRVVSLAGYRYDLSQVSTGTPQRGDKIAVRGPGTLTTRGATGVLENVLKEDDALMCEFYSASEGWVLSARNFFYARQEQGGLIVAEPGIQTSEKSVGIFPDQANTINAYVSGRDSVAIGSRTKVTSNAFGSVAIGTGSVGQARECVAVGYQSQATNMRNIAIGYWSNAQSLNSVAVGYGAMTSGLTPAGVAIGRASRAKGKMVVIGRDVSEPISGDNGVFIGADVDARFGNFHSMAVGDSSGVGGRSATALGYGAHAQNAETLAAGSRAYASQAGGVAMGCNALSQGFGTVAVGYGSFGGTGSVSTGFNSYSVNGGTAVGMETLASGVSATVIGYRSYSTDTQGVAIGSNTRTHHSYDVCISSNRDLGTSTASIVIGNSFSGGGDGTPALGVFGYSGTHTQLAFRDGGGNGLVRLVVNGTAVSIEKDGVGSLPLGNLV